VPDALVDADVPPLVDELDEDVPDDEVPDDEPPDVPDAPEVVVVVVGVVGVSAVCPWAVPACQPRNSTPTDAAADASLALVLISSSLRA